MLACLPAQVWCSGPGFSPGLGQGLGGGAVEGGVAAALERPRVEVQAGQNFGHQVHLKVLAGERPAHQGQLLRAEAEGLSGAAGDQRQGLKGLGQRPQAHQGGGVPQVMPHAAGCISHREITPVA